MEVKQFSNYHDFFHFVQHYEGELILKMHYKVYDGNTLVAELNKKEI